MTEQPQSEKSIFLAAIEIDSAAERAAFLEKACAGSLPLRAQVEALLHAHDKPQRLLDVPAAEPTMVDEPLTECPGTIIGPYKLLEQIGEGGFGVVFMAEQQQPVRRKVALKVLKPGMDSRQVVARFEAERQALAIMDHPHIAKVFDGGAAASGRPYFVMELVRGVPITDFCDQKRLSVRERLGLFVSVCQAVQHAHLKGVIHRDLKPSNVLVTLHDDKAVVKVIDFGIAKATGQQLTDKTLFTNFAQMIGTPLYMSPEQAQLSGLDVDTRSDIYALGVLLYELLTGTTPFDRERLRTVGYDEIRRMIREEEPPRPSRRLSTLAQAATTASAHRQSDPKRLSQLFRGELDWIVMKALEKDRNRRYESASAFAADVERYLQDEPVLAGPPSAWYRFRKFARRNKRAVVTATAVALAVVLAVAVLATSTVLIAGALEAETQARNDLEQALQRERRDAYFHRISLAQSELSVNNLGRALQLLDDCPEDLRNWEWHYLQRLCRTDPVTLQGQGGGIRGVAFSPKGRCLATANEDGTVGLFDLEAGVALPSLHGHKRKVRSVAFHPLGTRLASVSTDLTVKVWDVTTRQVVFELPGNEGSHAGPASGVAFSPDGRLLAAGSDGGTVIVCNANNGQVLQRLPGHGRMWICVAFSPDSRLLATGSWMGMLQVWDAQTGEFLWSKAEDDRTMSAVAFSPDGRLLATTGYDRLVRLWDVTTRKLVRQWRGHDCIILGVAFSADGKRLATIGGEDKTVKLWDPLTGREILKLRGHTYFGSYVAFSPDGQRLASSGLDGTVRIWDAAPAKSGQELLTLKHDDEVWSVAFSPDGQRIASSSFDKTVRLWDATTGAPLHRLTLSSQGYLLAFSRDGKRLASISRDKTARVWDATTGEEQCVLTTPHDHLYGVTFSPDGRFLLVDDVGGQHGKDGGSHAVTVWDAQTGQTSPKVIGIVGRHSEDIWCLKFSVDGNLLASGSNDGTVKLWHWDPARPGQPQKPVHSFPVRNYGFGDCVAFTPNSERLVTASGPTVTIWDVKTGDPLHTLRGHSGDVIAVAVSPDGRWLATAGEDTTIVLWDTTTWERQHTLRGHTGMVMSLAFSPNSARLVSGSRDGKVKVWDMTRWVKGPDR
jgi:WD40 repeat protein/serine/threonine protein kinase